VVGGSASQTIENADAIHGVDGMGNLSHTLPEIDQDYEQARYSD
jgi:hypothetical protein